MGCFTTDGARKGDTESANGRIGVHIRIARGLRNRHDHTLRTLECVGGNDTQTAVG
jgi:hypothetical protein